MLTATQAAALRSQLGETLHRQRSFVRTEGIRRADGSYEVVRRNADSTGNSVVFDGFDVVEQLYGKLPETFITDDVGEHGQTGSRRHLLVRFFAEHPAFDCAITSRCPLTAQKQSASADTTTGQEEQIS